MTALTLTVGYPPHALAEYTERDTANGVRLTDWRAVCGATGQQVGRDPFRPAGIARKRELCRACFPAGHATFVPDPVRRDAT